MTCAQNGEDPVILTDNFLTGEAAEWHLSFLERNAHQTPPFLRCAFEEYWESLSKEFTDILNLENTWKKMIELKMQGTNLTACVDRYRTFNRCISINPRLTTSWFLDGSPYDLSSSLTSTRFLSLQETIEVTHQTFALYQFKKINQRYIAPQYVRKKTVQPEKRDFRAASQIAPRQQCTICFRTIHLTKDCRYKKLASQSRPVDTVLNLETGNWESKYVRKTKKINLY
jgi:hypothetical protein